MQVRRFVIVLVLAAVSCTGDRQIPIEVTNDSMDAVPEAKPAPTEQPLSAVEKKLIAAIIQAPAPDDPREPRRPQINPSKVGSVGYLVRHISVQQVMGPSSFLGTTTWRVVQPRRDSERYIPNTDGKYTIWFRNVDTTGLFDEKILTQFPPTDAWPGFDELFEAVEPSSYETAIGARRTVMTVRRIDGARVRKLTDGKTPEQLAELLRSLDRAN